MRIIFIHIKKTCSKRKKNYKNQ